MKKLLIAILMLNIFCQASFAFTDTSSFLWAKDAVDKWSLGGYVSGYPDGSFRGNNFITRAEVISVINRLNNSDAAAKKRPSKDVSQSDWFFEDMARAKDCGLVSVEADGNLRPNDYATREEVMVILAKLFDISYSGNLEKAKIKKFNDSFNINSENFYKVAGIVEEGYVNGYRDNTLRPKANITRAEFLSILNNAIDTVLSNGEYSNRVIFGNVVINGKGVVLTNSQVKGKVFIFDGARDYEPSLINTKVSKGVNSRVGNALIKNTDEFATLSEYNYNKPEEINEPVIATLKYSETDWTNDDVDVRISFDNDDVWVKDKKITFDKNGNAKIEYEYNGQKMYINAKVENIDKTKPVVSVDVQNNIHYATVTVTVGDDELSPIAEMSCNGITNKPDKETGVIDNVFTIKQDGTYTVLVEDKAGNVGKAKFSVEGLREPDVTYKIEHYLQKDDGTYPVTASSTVEKAGINKEVIQISSIEKLNENGYEYVYGMVGNTKVTETALDENTVIKIFYEIRYLISYDVNGGVGNFESQKKSVNEEVVLSDIIPKKANCTFLGWSDDGNDLTAKYKPGDRFFATENTVLYAIWK